jgi:hypothetical protein
MESDEIFRHRKYCLDLIFAIIIISSRMFFTIKIYKEPLTAELLLKISKYGKLFSSLQQLNALFQKWFARSKNDSMSEMNSTVIVVFFALLGLSSAEYVSSQ